MKSTPIHPLSPRSVLITSSHVYLGPLKWRIFYVIRLKFSTFFPFPQCVLRDQSISVNFVVLIIGLCSEGHKLWNSSLCYFSRLPIISSVFDSDILISTVFSNSLPITLTYVLRPFMTCYFLRRGGVSPRANPEFDDHPLSAVCQLLLSIDQGFPTFFEWRHTWQNLRDSVKPHSRWDPHPHLPLD
jgi:hypothetical protein